MLTLQSWEVEGSLPKAVVPSLKIKSLLQQGKVLYDVFLHLARSFLKEPSGRWLRRNVGSLVALKTAYAHLLVALDEAGATVVWRDTSYDDPLITEIKKLDIVVKRKGLLDFTLQVGLGDEFWKDLEEISAIGSFLLNVLLAIKRGRLKASQKTQRKVRRLLRKYFNALLDLWFDVVMLREMVEEKDEELVDVEEAEKEIERILSGYESENH